MQMWTRTLLTAVHNMEPVISWNTACSTCAWNQTPFQFLVLFIFLCNPPDSSPWFSWGLRAHYHIMILYSECPILAMPYVLAQPYDSGIQWKAPNLSIPFVPVRFTKAAYLAWTLHVLTLSSAHTDHSICAGASGAYLAMRVGLMSLYDFWTNGFSFQWESES